MTASEALFSPIEDIDALRILLADLHDDLTGKVARFRQLCDLSVVLGSNGTMLPGGEVALAAWIEARSSFVHGNYIATVQVCQSLAEHVLADHMATEIDSAGLPKRVKFNDTLKRCIERGLLSDSDAGELRKLMSLRNPLAHYQAIEDPSNLAKRSLTTGISVRGHLLADASFAISAAVRLLSLPAFRLGD